MSKKVNNDVTMNPPVLDRGYWIPFCADTKIYPGIVWTATVHDWSKSFTHIKHRFGAVLNTNLHFCLSRVPVLAPTHLLPVRFEYLFTLPQRWTETYPVNVNPLQDWRSAALFRYKSHCCYVITWFFVSTQELSGIVSEHSLNKKGKSLQLQL